VTGPEPADLAPGTAIGMAAAVLRRPDLWWTALGALIRLARPGWWRTGRRLPLPDARLWAFRMVTAYGDPGATPEAADVLAYLEWCRSTGPPGRLARGPIRARRAESRPTGIREG
jgi:hypothetical protein